MNGRFPVLVSSQCFVAGILAILLWGVLGEEGKAQEFGRASELETNVAYFYHGRPGEATVQVSVWGVQQPGIYEVVDSTRLDRLITMAGGAPFERRQEDQERPRITVRLYRPSQGGQSLLFEAQLAEMFSGDATYPVLRDDDIVVMETVQPTRFTWRDVVSLTSTGLSLTLVILRIIRFRG